MNHLNEKLRSLRIQIAAEEMREIPNLEALKELREEEQKCLKLLKE